MLKLTIVQEYDGRMVVLLLRLEMITAASAFDPEQYFDGRLYVYPTHVSRLIHPALHRIVRTVHMTTPNYMTYIERPQLLVCVC